MRVDLEFPQAIPTVKITFTRFVTGLAMHLLLQRKLRQGLDKMKFALNHFWRFDSVGVAFMSGLLQTLMIVFVQLLLFSIVVLSHDIIEVMTHFLALFVVSKLDEVFFSELSATGEITRKIISDKKFASLRLIQTTTSCDGANGEECALRGEELRVSRWVNSNRKSLRDFYSKELLADKKIT